MLKCAEQHIASASVASTENKKSWSQGHEIGLKIRPLNIKKWFFLSLFFYTLGFLFPFFPPNHDIVYFFPQFKDDFFTQLQSSTTCSCMKTTATLIRHRVLKLLDEHQCFWNFLTSEEYTYQSWYCINLSIFILYTYIFLPLRLLMPH